MILRVTVTGEVECHETRSRSESEPEEGAQSVGVDAKPSVDHLVSRLPPLTVRPVQARFHCGYVSRDTQPRQ